VVVNACDEQLLRGFSKGFFSSLEYLRAALSTLATHVSVVNRKTIMHAVECRFETWNTSSCILV